MSSDLEALRAKEAIAQASPKKGSGGGDADGPSLTSLQVPGLGNITGWKYSDNTCQFFGVPYATIPARFRPSELSSSWSGHHFDATKLGRYCPQPARPFYPFPMPERPHLGESIQGEFDCCNLNLTLPPGTCPQDRHAVMVFIHGGAFVYGTSNYSIVDGRPLACQSSNLGVPTIICNINYRVGWYGFLASDDIKADNEGKFNGNWGLHDQRNALRWLNQHISAFGGDPAKITIFGQSAGAISVDVFLQSPSTWNLFRRAILMSGAVPICGNYTEGEYHVLYEKLLDVLGIYKSLSPSKRLAALREVPHERLSAHTAAAFGNIGLPQFGPCDDGALLGQDVRIPRTDDYTSLKYEFPGHIMIGDCEHEGIIYCHEFTDPLLSPSELIDMVNQHLDVTAAKDVKEHYGITLDMSEEQKFRAAEAMITDGVFVAPAHYATMNTPEKVFRYHWFQRSQWDNDWGRGVYAHHSMDYMYTFGGLVAIMTPEEKKLGEAIARDYILFANNIDPYPVFGEKQNIRVYGPSTSVNCSTAPTFSGRDQIWLERIKAFAGPFADLCFDISMRRSSYLDPQVPAGQRPRGSRLPSSEEAAPL